MPLPLQSLKHRPFHPRTALSATALALSLALAGCASGPSDNLSLVPAQLDQQTRLDGLFTQPVKWSRERPGCQGECPKLVVDSLVFPGHPRLTTLIDHALAAMTWVDVEHAAPYDTLDGFEAYYWKTAGARDEVHLTARTRYRNERLTVVELDAGQYRTGMAHGMGGSQLLNWDNASEKALTIDNLLAPGARPAFDAALRAEHARWLDQHADAIDDRDSFDRMWPFASSDNVGLTDAGVLVKYQPYEIAPYAWGQPELLIPYDRLRGVLRPQYLPPQS
ncbi:MAG: RsiV family protein [Castellaniella sp.]|uniref:RsiV family protein n=1 Tax=Castellaniella sp. TaxID=1955812 RepID=UPI002A363B69|nr:RsiV family protein [Castellaniella sp.]MDY0308174.1 RsiV family protein [Castellaniella sp.]